MTSKYIYINLGNLIKSDKNTLLNYYLDNSDSFIIYINKEYEMDIYNKLISIPNVYEKVESEFFSTLYGKITDESKEVIINEEIFAYEIIKNSKRIVSLGDCEDFVVDDICDKDIENLYALGIDNSKINIYDSPAENIQTIGFEDDEINALIKSFDNLKWD